MAVKAKAEVTLASIKDVASVTRYYLLQSSSSAVPAKPTANPPGGNWVRTEPSYTTGSTNSLYFTDLTVFSDNTFTYSDVSLSSSYEAAKVAYNRATAAQDSVQNLKIGGRNLARGTGDTTGVHWVKTRATEADGVLTITPTTYAAYGKYIMENLPYGENVNQTFTLSFDAREMESASGYGTGAILIYMGVQSPSRVNSILQSAYDRYRQKNLSIAGEGWHRYSVSYTFPSEITTGQASAFTDDAIISFEIGRYASTCPLEIKNCKLERGGKATDWTPAPEDVDSRIASPNLSPFFGYVPYSVGDYWSAWPAGDGFTFTPKGDGWVRVQKDNSEGTAVVRHDVIMTRIEAVQPGSDYTFLLEFRNNNSAGGSTGSDCYLVQSNNCQFWGNGIKRYLEGIYSSSSSTNLISDYAPGTEGVYRKRFIKTSEPSDSAHWTGAVNNLLCLTFRCAAGGTIDYEVRVSLYAGEYTGDYMPYAIDAGDFALVKDTANTALSNADDALAGVETVRLYAESSIDQRADEIELSISAITGTLTTDIQDCQDAIAATEDALTGSVNDLSSRVLTQEEALQAYQHQTSTYFRFNADGLNIGKQSDGDDSPYSINIDNEKMGFLQNGVEIAYVQYNKMHINAIEAMDRMSVGAAADGGYFDFISTVYGMGVKWRAVNQSQSTPRSAPLLRSAARPAVYQAVTDEEGVFSVDFGGDQK